MPEEDCRAIWAALEMGRPMTLDDLQIITDCEVPAIITYLSILLNERYVKMPGGRTAASGEPLPLFQLIKRTGPEAPNLSDSGEFIDPNLPAPGPKAPPKDSRSRTMIEPTLTSRMRLAAERFNRPFTMSELRAAVGSENGRETRFLQEAGSPDPSGKNSSPAAGSLAGRQGRNRRFKSAWANMCRAGVFVKADGGRRNEKECGEPASCKKPDSPRPSGKNSKAAAGSLAGQNRGTLWSYNRTPLLDSVRSYFREHIGETITVNELTEELGLGRGSGPTIMAALDLLLAEGYHIEIGHTHGAVRRATYRVERTGTSADCADDADENWAFPAFVGAGLALPEEGAASSAPTKAGPEYVPLRTCRCRHTIRVPKSAQSVSSADNSPSEADHER